MSQRNRKNILRNVNETLSEYNWSKDFQISLYQLNQKNLHLLLILKEWKVKKIGNNIWKSIEKSSEIRSSKLWEVTKKIWCDYVGNESENEVRDKKHSKWEKWSLVLDYGGKKFLTVHMKWTIKQYFLLHMYSQGFFPAIFMCHLPFLSFTVFLISYFIFRFISYVVSKKFLGYLS